MTGRILFRVAATAAAALLSAALPVGATTLLEYDFQTAPTGVDQPASASIASTKATLIDTNGPDNAGGTLPVITTGPTGANTLDPAVKNGYATFQGSISLYEDGMVTQNTAVSGHNHMWVDFFGSGNGMGTGTAIVVFRPHDTVHNGRGPFITSGIGDYGSFSLADDSASNGPQLLMSGVTLNFNNTVGNWDTNKWYLLVASWASPGTAYLYMQALTPGSPLFFTSGGATNDALIGVDHYVTQPIVFNTVSNADGYYNLSEETYPFLVPVSTGPTFNGDIALYRLTRDFTDSTADFSAIYAVIAPEPASAALLGLGAVTMLRRRR